LPTTKEKKTKKKSNLKLLSIGIINYLKNDKKEKLKKKKKF
jgi:hypothetical protein